MLVAPRKLVPDGLWALALAYLSACSPQQSTDKVAALATPCPSGQEKILGSCRDIKPRSYTTGGDTGAYPSYSPPSDSPAPDAGGASPSPSASPSDDSGTPGVAGGATTSGTGGSGRSTSGGSTAGTTSGGFLGGSATTGGDSSANTTGGGSGSTTSGGASGGASSGGGGRRPLPKPNGTTGGATGSSSGGSTSGGTGGSTSGGTGGSASGGTSGSTSGGTGGSTSGGTGGRSTSGGTGGGNRPPSGGGTGGGNRPPDGGDMDGSTAGGSSDQALNREVSFPSDNPSGPPQIKVIAALNQNRKVSAYIAFSRPDQVSGLSVSYGHDRQTLNGAPQASSFVASGLQLPINITFSYGGQQCQAMGTVGFTEGTLQAICN